MSPPSGRPILVVDDDPDDRHLIVEAMQLAGIKSPIETVDDGDAAMARLGRPVTPALITLDIKMPKVDGLETLCRIRKSQGCGAIPIIMLTGSALPGDVARAAACGANAFLVKPSSHDTLVAMMRSIKDFWLTFHQQPPALSSQGHFC